MILGVLFLLGGVASVVMAFGRLRAARDPNWVRSDATRLVIAPLPGRDEARVALWRGDRVAFGPCSASWDPPRRMSGVPAPIVGSGEYRVVAAVDLGAEDALGTGDPGVGMAPPPQGMPQNKGHAGRDVHAGVEGAPPLSDDQQQEMPNDQTHAFAQQGDQQGEPDPHGQNTPADPSGRVNRC